MDSFFSFYKKVIIVGFSIICLFLIINMMFNSYLIPHQAFYNYRNNSDFSNIIEITSDIEKDFSIETNSTLVHRSLHEINGILSRDDLDRCESSTQQECFIPCSSVILTKKDNFFSKNLLVGDLPKSSAEVCLNSLTVRKMGINIGDTVLLSTPMGPKKVIVSGFINDSYGIVSYSAKDFSYYCIRNESPEDLHTVKNYKYDFDRTHVSWKSRQKELFFKFLLLYAIYSFVLIVSMLHFNNIYEQTIDLNSYLKNLKVIGKTTKKNRYIEYCKILLLDICICLIMNIVSWNLNSVIIQIIVSFMLFSVNILNRSHRWI